MSRRVLLVMCAAAVAHADPAPSAPAPDTLSALLSRTDAVAKEVSKLRGLPLKTKIPNEVVDKAELRKRLLEMAQDAKTASETAAEGLALARWGLIPLDTDYTQLLVDLLTDQIAGYYDPKTKKLTISQSAGDDADWAEMVLAHEIEHGLQDQKWDLQKFEDLPSTEDDAAVARHALVEGDGIVLMLEVMFARAGKPAPWGNAELAAGITKAMAEGADATLDHAPLAIREGMMFPYRAGFSFVAALRRRKAWSAVDNAFAKPPKSTEQVLHVDRYLAHDDPKPVALAVLPSLADYTQSHSTVWGELGFDLFLRSHGISEVVAAQAAAGWGGDRVVLYTREPKQAAKSIGIARSTWDTDEDAIEADQALVRAIDDAIAGATVEHGDTLTRWVALDGTVSWVERRGKDIVMVHGAPARVATALATEVWAAALPQNTAARR